MSAYHLHSASASADQSFAFSVAATFAHRKVSLFPTSIFPASFVLSCKAVQTNGPMTLECPAGSPEQHSLDYWASQEGQQEIGMRVWQQAEFDALTAGG